MEETLASYQGPQETIQDLIQLALRGGGPDNITCIVADVLDVDSNDTLAGQLNDTPVVVGAVAENQAQLGDGGAMQTPAGRAAGLGRPVPPPAGGFGPPGSGDVGYGGMPDGSYDAYTDEDFAKPGGGRKWLKRSVFIVLALAVIGGGLYGGYRWTQTQYYVGAQDENVALFQGISQDLAWVSLSKIEKNHPEIELKYLPPYQRKQVEATIAEGNITDAREKVAELAAQASACKKDAQRRAADAENRARTGEGEAGGTAGAPATRTSATSSAKGTKPTTAPTPGPSLSEEEKKLVPQCGKQ
ncbi:hypothetical protein M2436_003677 [Streptomyces sp. HB372]|nr:hypothetical protein [Streptomyces sp. HB372]